MISFRPKRRPNQLTCLCIVGNAHLQHLMSGSLLVGQLVSQSLFQSVIYSGKSISQSVTIVKITRLNILPSEVATFVSFGIWKNVSWNLLSVTLGTIGKEFTKKNPVKPELAVTSFKQPTCLKQPNKMFPNINFVLIFTSVKQPPALSSHFLCFPLCSCLTQV